MNSVGYGLDFGKFGASLNYDFENAGLNADISLGNFDIFLGFTLKGGITLGHSYTDDFGKVTGMSAAMLPLIPPAGSPATTTNPDHDFVPSFETVP